MAIDYSKWDKLELSDDSDIEVHPNVDKNSFIKWKQRDIHEKRDQRNQEIKTILVQLTMYAKLNARVDFILKEIKLLDVGNTDLVMAKLNKEFDADEKFNYEELIKQKGDNLRKGLKDLKFEKLEIENTPPYNEMIEDLFEQIKEDHPDALDNSKLIDYLREHRAKIDDVLSKQTIKLDELLYQKSLLISSDDYHTGFDRSFLNKDKDEPEPQPKVKATEKVTTVETINSPSESEHKEKSDAEMLDELELLPETEEFSKIKMDDYSKTSEYLIKHSWICTEQQKDALIMTAFDSQFQGDKARTKQIIHQSLLLQYIAQLSGGPKGNKESRIKGIKLFLSKISENGPARTAFFQDVENTLAHIVERCKLIQQEQEQEQEEGEQIIQLRSLDENAPLTVHLPSSDSEEFKIFQSSLPKPLQEAIKTEKIDEVNKVFAQYQIEEAEKYLEVLNQCGIIRIESILEDEEQYNMLKEEYDNQEDLQKEIDQLEVNDDSVVHDTTDIVD